MNKTDIPEIKVLRTWSANKVRAMCIAHSFYTLGSNEEYGEMLEFVMEQLPTTESLWIVARDISEHSTDDMPITSIMFLLEREAVVTTFNIEE